ncbi:hypothetical protein C0989_012428 [Termitomyces sp. Mn162]|nr:hypothetical protein C0989_012428 [Termitomyces sp. Mn162]
MLLTQLSFLAMMAPNHPIPTIPCKNPMGPATKLPHVPPTAHPSSGQNLPDNFALLQCSVKHEMHQVILAVLQLSLFDQAIISICGVAVGIPGSWADCTKYLSTIQLCFADQANFLSIAEQKSLFDSLTATLSAINHSAINDSIDVQAFLSLTLFSKLKKIGRRSNLKQQTQDQDVDMLGPLSIHSGKGQANISLACQVLLITGAQLHWASPY